MLFVLQIPKFLLQDLKDMILQVLLYHLKGFPVSSTDQELIESIIYTVFKLNTVFQITNIINIFEPSVNSCKIIWFNGLYR